MRYSLSVVIMGFRVVGYSRAKRNLRPVLVVQESWDSPGGSEYANLKATAIIRLIAITLVETNSSSVASVEAEIR